MFPRFARPWVDADARSFGIGYLLLLPLYLAPLFVARFLPGLDLPFHLSMVDMLSKQGSPTNPYQPYFEGGFSVSPYAAHYLALRLLGLVLPLMTAHKLVVAVYVAALPLTAALLLSACGRSRVPALLTFPLAYNLCLHYGFVSFVLSLPVVFALLAFLALFLKDPRTKLSLAAAAALAAVALFLCHLQNFLYGVCAALAFVAFARCAWRRRLLGAATLLPAIGLLLIWHRTRDFVGPAGATGSSWKQVWNVVWARRRSEVGGRSWIEESIYRLDMLSSHLLRGFTDWIDAIATRTLLVALAGYFVLGIVGLLARSDGTFRPRLRVAGFIAFAGAMFAYLALPHHLPEFELMTFHPRFSVLAVAMSVLVVPGSLRRLGGLARPLVLLPALLVGGFYGFELIRHYRYYDKEVADFAAVVEKTPPGGRALGLVFDRYSRVMRIESALVSLPNLYPVLRPGPNAMVPLAYCGMRHMPCRRLTPEKPLPAPSAWSPLSLQAEAAIDFFDYFFVRLPPNQPIFGAGLDRLQLIAQEGSWLVYGRKPKAPPGPLGSAPTARKP